MVEFCDQVLLYTDGYDLASLSADRMRFDATMRNLELIGEAATHVPAEVRETAPDIPWRLIVGLRNRLIHAYLSIEPETVWLVITQHVSPLRERLAKLAANSDSDEDQA
ncbi:HepT-like ribonuclease domain-containing protein [Roseateles sp. P5_E7]